MAHAPKPPKEHFIFGSRLHALALAECEDTSGMTTTSANATSFRTRVEGRLVNVYVIEVDLETEAGQKAATTLDDEDDDSVY